MPEDEYHVDISSPCDPPRINAVEIATNQYTGSDAAGDVELILGKGGRWIIFFSPTDQNSGCYQTTRFLQDTPNATDPVGSYSAFPTGSATVSAL